MPIHAGDADARPVRDGAVVGDRRMEESNRRARLREANDRIAELSGWLGEIDRFRLICECADPTCGDVVEVGAAEYEAVRADGRRFVVCPGHQLDGHVERVVEGNGRFVVVEKLGRTGEAPAVGGPGR